VDIKDIQFRGFRGGLNTRDQAGELGEEEIPDALNVTIDERGSAMKRLGYERRFSTAIGAGTVSNLFNWRSRGFIVEQEGPRMRINDGAAFLTWSTSDRCGMTEFLGNLVMIHPVDGVRMYDGTSVTGPFANFPLGTTCSAWQGKCWFAGNPVNGSRVSFTDIGAMTMGVNNWVDLREKDDSKVNLLTGAAGLDVSGRPGLLAFKNESSYRIYDSATGAYNTIDASVGCGSNIGAVSAYGRTYVVSPRGIYYTNGLDPLVEASAKIENLFHGAVLNLDRPDLYAAGRYQDRLRFSVPAAGDTFNSISIETHPLSGWMMLHTDAASCYASTDADIIMGSPTVAGLVYNGYKTGSDDGADIASYMQTFWVEPNFGNLTRIRRARFVGYGAFTAALYKDYESGQSLESLSVDISSDTPQWDDGTVWDGGATWGPSSFQSYQDFWSIGTARSFSIRISETSSLTRPGRNIVGQSTDVQGAWTLSHINLMTIGLGFR
jgi:hypothetical protein